MPRSRIRAKAPVVNEPATVRASARSKESSSLLQPQHFPLIMMLVYFSSFVLFGEPFLSLTIFSPPNPLSILVQL